MSKFLLWQFKSIQENKAPREVVDSNAKIECDDEEGGDVKQRESNDVKCDGEEESSYQPLKQQKLFQKQNENVQVTCACNISNNPHCIMYGTILKKYTTKARFSFFAKLELDYLVWLRSFPRLSKHGPGILGRALFQESIMHKIM